MAFETNVTEVEFGTKTRIVFGLLIAVSIIAAGGAAGAASDSVSTGDAGWYLGEASLIWGMVNGDWVSVGLGATGMVIAGGSLIVASGGASAVLAL